MIKSLPGIMTSEFHRRIAAGSCTKGAAADLCRWKTGISKYSNKE
jgi:hypothetical protein